MPEFRAAVPAALLVSAARLAASVPPASPVVLTVAGMVVVAFVSVRRARPRQE